jgi:hypothetical protein
MALADRLLSLAGPQLAEAMGNVSAGLVTLNQHLTAIAANTSAIGERLAALDAGQVRLITELAALREEQTALARIILKREYDDGHLGNADADADAGGRHRGNSGLVIVGGD